MFFRFEQLVLVHIFIFIPYQFVYLSRIIQRKRLALVFHLFEVLLFCTGFLLILKALKSDSFIYPLFKGLTVFIALSTFLAFINVFPVIFTIAARSAHLEMELGLMQSEQDASSKLRRFTSLVRQTLDFDTILKTAAVEMTHTFNAKSSACYLESDHEFKCVSECSPDPSFSWKSFQMSKQANILTLAKEHNSAVYIYNLHLLVPPAPFHIAYAIVFELADHVHGFFILADFRYENVRLFDDAIGQFVIALNQARFLKQEKQRVEELEIRLKENIELSKSRHDAEVSSKLKSEFLAMMSHEIRTPMNAVTGFLEALLKTPLNVDQRNMLEIVSEASNQLLLLLNDILDISKIEDNSLTFESAPFKIYDLIESAIQIMIPAMAKKNILIEKYIAHDIPEVLIGDFARLRQILVNLLSNAVKFTNKGLVVVSLKGKVENEKFHMELRVKDTGIGIANDDIPKLFKKFTQVDSSVSRKYGGSGLGLAICSNLVRLFGGEILVESELNVGTTFIVKLFTEISPSQMSQEELSLRSMIKNINHVCIVDSSEPCINGHLNRMKWIQIPSKVAKTISEALRYNPGICVVDELTLLSLPDQEWRFLQDQSNVLWVLLGQPFQTHLDKRIKIEWFKGVLKKPCKRFLWLECFAHLQVLGSVKPETKPAELSPDFSILNVLTVDDNPINQTVMKRLLQNIGLDCIAQASDGFQAVDLASSEKFDVIFMDLSMPGLDGIEATKIILSNYGSFEPYIVAFTAHGMQEYKTKAIQAGMKDFLVKPVKSKELVHVLENPLKLKLLRL